MENDFSIDSIGFRTTTFSAYNRVKHGQIKEHQFVKAHLFAGAKTNIVAAVAITDRNGGDSLQFGSLVKKTAEGFTIDEISSDMAYSSLLNYQLAANVGGKAYIPFKKSATGRAGGSALWKKMFHTSSSIAMNSWNTTISEAI